MVVIGLCGLPGSGKRAVETRLIEEHNFTRLVIGKTVKGNPNGGFSPPAEELERLDIFEKNVQFDCLIEALDFVTTNWREDYVVSGLKTEEDFFVFLKRPFFMIISILAPVMARFHRFQITDPSLTLKKMIEMDDDIMYGKAGLIHVMTKSRLTISNGSNIENLYSLVRSLTLDERWARPSWDAYFMEMAELASRRSNCMKRRVGAIIVKDKRVVATGYNGTAQGLLNCCEGGCLRCNSNVKCGVGLDLCYCLHAEENAVLEAGRSRCQGATLYCTTAPCVGCSRKIIQCGILRVVYAQEYSIEHNARHMFETVGAQLDKFTLSFPHYLDADDFLSS